MDPLHEHQMTHGVFSWNELMANDSEDAKEFYAALFGWSFEEVPTEQGEYTVAKVGDRQVAGIFQRPPSIPLAVPPHWGAYVTVTDVEDTVLDVSRLGGNVLMPPTLIPNLGTFAVIQDPQGAILNVMEYCAEVLEAGEDED